MVATIIIAVLAVAIIGFGGWKLYNHYNKQNNAVASSNQNTTKTPINNENNQSATRAQQTDPNAGYFVIKQWGVKFKLVSNLDGLEYAIRFNNSQVVFSTPSITAVDAQCSDLATGFGGIGALDRYVVDGEQPITGASYLATINGYKYYYGGSGGGDCVYDASNTAGQNLLHTQEQSIGNSVRSLEATQPIYLDIKELGIKIKLSDSIKDVIYSYSAPTSKAYATFGGSVYASTQSLTSKDAACAAKSGSIGAIAKITGNVDGFGNLLTADNNTIFKLGDNYYRYETPQSPCSNNSSVNELASEQKAAFREAFKTIQLDQ